ncbi:MAG: hypothetical protein CBB71_17370 [Rhodopirellula sp. TMED11]|nr:MAG: hypothetical protein CBB71_17370 [Rhodopirellula sp. TMED11]
MAIQTSFVQIEVFQPRRSDGQSERSASHRNSVPTNRPETVVFWAPESQSACQSGKLWPDLLRLSVLGHQRMVVSPTAIEHLQVLDHRLPSFDSPPFQHDKPTNQAKQPT